MPPKSKKRKATTSTSNGNDANGTLAPPDRATWPGWVEMESEPAFFNVMLKEMGVRGVKIQEVYGLDDEMLAILPQPVHALIFLFRYRETEQDKLNASCPKDVWFANQVPDFACATVAILNIVNNIPGLQMGKELRDFKEFTQDLDPLSRGDSIDSFEYVKRIHNSFARESDLLQADMHLKEKAAKARKRQAVAKGAATKAAAKAAKAAKSTPLKEQSPNITVTASRSSGRLKRPASRGSGATSKASTPSKEANVGKKRSAAAKTAKAAKAEEDDDDDDFESPSKKKSSVAAGVKPATPRRSERKPKLKVDLKTAAAEEADETGFHFCAYMPINGHVWKLDGMDNYPLDMGAFDAENGGGWMSIAQPTLQGRMAQYEAGEIEFNLMAVVHDPLAKEMAALLENVKALQAIDKKLDGVYEDWREMDGAETKKEVFTDVPVELGATKGDLDAAELPKCTADKVENEENMMKLIDVRKDIILQQTGLRAAVRDELRSSEADDEKARHRRHDYGGFVKGWLGALADEAVLSKLLDDDA